MSATYQSLTSTPISKGKREKSQGIVADSSLNSNWSRGISSSQMEPVVSSGSQIGNENSTESSGVAGVGYSNTQFDTWPRVAHHTKSDSPCLDQKIAQVKLLLSKDEGTDQK